MVGLLFSPEDFAQLGGSLSLKEALAYSLCLGSDQLPTSFEFFCGPLLLYLLMGILTALSHRVLVWEKDTLQKIMVG